MIRLAMIDLFSGKFPGHQTLTIDIEGAHLTSGIYIYRIVGESFVASRQITLIR
ncbi:MAG: hypothetical protein HKN43_13785 [Rhodothermales bacterium]|nr:hypothetical protein [Rhodothermales bacterium]